MEFLGLPFSLWIFVEDLVKPIGHFIFHKPHKFYTARPQHRVFVEVDLAKDLKETINIQVGDTQFSQQILYINLLNTFFHCQSVDHMIQECLLMASLAPSVNEKKNVNPKMSSSSSEG